MSNHMHDKSVFLQGQEYVIKKFTPQVGCFWAFKVMGKLMGGAAGSEVSGLDVAKIVEDFTRMEPKEFQTFQKDCLSFVFVKFDSGLHPLVNPEGFLTQPDMPGPIAFLLMIESFKHSIFDFFGEDVLKSLMGQAAQDPQSL